MPGLRSNDSLLLFVLAVFFLFFTKANCKIRVTDLWCSTQLASWKLENDSAIHSIKQRSMPIFANIALSRNLTATINTVLASSKVIDGTFDDFVLSGLTDLKLGGSYLTCLRNPDDFLITFGLNIPTPRCVTLEAQGIEAKYGLDADERYVQRWISRDFLDIPTTHYWAGWEMDLGAYHAWVLSKKVCLGLGASYYYRGAFRYFSDLPKEKLDLGDELALTIGLDIDLLSYQYSLDFNYTIRGKDKLGNKDYFYPGEKIICAYNGIYRWPLNFSSLRRGCLVELEPGISYRHVFGNRFNEKHPWVGSIDFLQFEDLGSRQADASLKASVWVTRILNFIVLGNYRVFWNKRDKIGNMWTVGAGFCLENSSGFANWCDIEIIYHYSFKGRQSFFGSDYNVSGSFISAGIKVKI